MSDLQQSPPKSRTPGRWRLVRVSAENYREINRLAKEYEVSAAKAAHWALRFGLVHLGRVRYMTRLQPALYKRIEYPEATDVSKNYAEGGAATSDNEKCTRSPGTAGKG